MDTMLIQGGQKLEGEIEVKGSKNAALAILPATVLLKGKATLKNLPKIGDVMTMVGLLESMGAETSWLEDNTLEISTDNIDPTKLDHRLVGRIRASLLLIGPLAARFGSVKISTPGGCNIGTRSIDAHLNALVDLGFKVETEEGYFVVSKDQDPPEEIIMSEFGVTATENCILAVVGLNASVTIRIAAQDPPVMDLCWFLQKSGAVLEGIGTHTLTIKTNGNLKAVDYFVMPDQIEAGTFLSLAGVSNSVIKIKSVPIDMLALELQKFKEAGVNFEFQNLTTDAEKNYRIADIQVKKSPGLKAITKLHDMPAPGFSPDIVQPFALLLTQAKGISLVYDWMYDGRLKYVKELKRMGADMKVLDAHRVMVHGPTPLFGKEITSYDLRAGATVLIAALIAEGQSIIRGVHQIDRGYENIDQRLKALGAKIERRDD